MAGSAPPEPWASFLADIDAAATDDIVLHCIGGFAVSLHYGLTRPTADLDVVEVAPDTARWLDAVAGRGSALHQKHRLYVQVVTVATLPYHHADRLTEMFADAFERLRIFVLDPYDLVLSKLSRNLEVDLEDAKYLGVARNLDLDVLTLRYHDELRPYLQGPLERHDQTLTLWTEAIGQARRD